VNTYAKAIALLTVRERWRGGVVLGMVIIMALLETAGVASVMPFLAVLGNPELIRSNAALAFLYQWVGFASDHAFLVALALASFVLIVVVAIFRSLTIYVIARFTEMRRHSIGSRLLETYLAQPYTFFLNRHSADLAKGILSEVDQLVSSVYRPAFDALAYAVVAGAIVLLLVLIDPWLALTVTVILGTAYAGLFVLVRRILGRFGKERLAANRERFTTAGEALGAIKEIKLLGREQAYLARFQPASMRFAGLHAKATALAEVPKYIIEALGLGGILLVALVLIAASDDLGKSLPVLGLYGFAGFRLLRAAQHIYDGLAKVRFGAAAVDLVYADVMQRGPRNKDDLGAPALRPLERIAFEDVSFAYPNAADRTLRRINLVIPVGTTLGLVGGTGAGKSTVVDILLGLLRPTDGVLSVDGVPIGRENLRSWQNALGYVPQMPFLADATIAENIALGIPRQRIDEAAVVRSARIAQLHEFIMESLPQQYDTQIGERGIRLSGGQRQRIAIARALYHDPAVLVFDEATSALDNLTEQAVMQAVIKLSHQKTIVLIAHRLSTVRGCDKVVLLDDGELCAEGSWEELLAVSQKFRAMADGERSVSRA
jgi:ATP-binding cassette, subfamily B, bacterial PglK